MGLSTPEEESASAEEQNDNDDDYEGVCVHGLEAYAPEAWSVK